MPTLPYFPAASFLEQDWLWEIMGSTIGGGQTATGQMPISRLDGGGLWKVTLGDIMLFENDERRAWAAFKRISDGGFSATIVPMRVAPDRPWPIVSGEELESYDPVFHEDDVPFDGDIGYHVDVIDAETVGSAVLQATTLRVKLNYGTAFRGGEFFSIDDAVMRWRLYQIATVEDLGGDEYNITFNPPLRAAVADGVRLVFDNPRCVMRLATPAAMDTTFRSKWLANPSVGFVETFPPFPT